MSEVNASTIYDAGMFLTALKKHPGLQNQYHQEALDHALTALTGVDALLRRCDEVDAQPWTFSLTTRQIRETLRGEQS